MHTLPSFAAPLIPSSHQPLSPPRRARRYQSPAVKATARPCPPSSPQSLSLAAAAAAAAALTALLSPPSIPPCHAAPSPLTQNTLSRRYLVTDSSALLRYSLPLDASSDPPVRAAQGLLEDVGVDLRARGAAGAAGVRRDLSRLDAVLREQGVDMLLQVPAKRRVEASGALAAVRDRVSKLEAEVGVGGGAGDGGAGGEFGLASKARETAEFVGAMAEAAMKKPTSAAAFDLSAADAYRNEALSSLAQLEEIMVEDGGLPFRIPRRYDALPRLEGRAKIELRVRHKPETKAQGSTDATSTMVLTLDGYSAPLNAGNMVDLVRRGVYDGTSIQASQRGFFLQFGNKSGEFVDPTSGLRRSIPMEVLVAGERSPVYGMTLDEAGVGDLQPVLPVTAFGAVASHHSTEDVNDASTTMYVFLFDPKSYQARSMGGNALNGSISTFGYVTAGAHVLPTLQAGDVIEKATVVSGMQYFKANANAGRPS